MRHRQRDRPVVAVKKCSAVAGACVRAKKITVWCRQWCSGGVCGGELQGMPQPVQNKRETNGVQVQRGKKEGGMVPCVCACSGQAAVPRLSHAHVPATLTQTHALCTVNQSCLSWRDREERRLAARHREGHQRGVVAEIERRKWLEKPPSLQPAPGPLPCLPHPQPPPARPVRMHCLKETPNPFARFMPVSMVGKEGGGAARY